MIIARILVLVLMFGAIFEWFKNSIISANEMYLLGIIGFFIISAADYVRGNR